MGWEGEEKFGAKNRDHPFPPRFSTDHPTARIPILFPIIIIIIIADNRPLENENRADERG